MTRTMILAGSFVLAATMCGHAAGLDGTYNGISQTTEYAGDPTAYAECVDRERVSLTVAASAVSFGKLAGKVATDGTFAITGNTGADNAAFTMNGTIQGERLTARWVLNKKKVDCAGEISARRQSQ